MMNSILYSYSAGDTPVLSECFVVLILNYEERKRQAALPQEGTMKASKSPKRII